MESWKYCFNKRLEHYFLYIYTSFLEFVYARCYRWRGLTFVAGFVTEGQQSPNKKAKVWPKKPWSGKRGKHRDGTEPYRPCRASIPATTKMFATRTIKSYWPRWGWSFIGPVISTWDLGPIWKNDWPAVIQASTGYTGLPRPMTLTMKRQRTWKSNGPRSQDDCQDW